MEHTDGGSMASGLRIGACAAGLAVLSACAPGARIDEDVIPASESWQVPEVSDLAFLIVMDDTEVTQDVWGAISSGSAKFFRSGQHFRMRFLSTYLDQDGTPLWMDQGAVIDDEAESDSLFAIEVQQVMHPAIRDRDVLTPRPRDALRLALSSHEGQDFIGEDHLVVLLASALYDHSEDTPAEEVELRWLMESQPGGSSLMMATPQGGGCKGLYSEVSDSHDQTRALLSESLVVDTDLCGGRWLDDVGYAFEDARGWQNHLEVTLSWGPLDGVVEVVGVEGQDEVVLDAAQWSLDGQQLSIGPPLRGFSEVRARYEREVGGGE